MGTVAEAEAVFTSALSRSNGHGLAYDRAYKSDIWKQIKDFIKAFPKTMPLIIARFRHDDGSEQKLLAFKGVISFRYKNAKYNAPMYIWLPLKFPRDRPRAHVHLTDRNQFHFNPQCRIVDASCKGRIRSDYYANWSYPRANLTDYIRDAQNYFSDCPPLYKNVYQQPGGRPITPTQPQYKPQQKPPPPQQQKAQVASAASVWCCIFSQEPSEKQREKQKAQQAKLLQQKEALRQQRASAYHLALTTALSSRLSGAMAVHQVVAAEDLQRQLTIQAELRGRSSIIYQEGYRLHQERDALDKKTQAFITSGTALDVWLKENEPGAQGNLGYRFTARLAGLLFGLRPPVSEEIDPDEAIVPSDILSEQALKAQSADLALEDTLGALDRAFEANQLPLAEYLAQVRGVSRKQFIARALSSKIAAKQMAEKAAAVAVVEGPSFFAQLPIGDVWYTSGGILSNPVVSAARENTR